ncbi:hypothetical protein [Actibacterium lipolyticum]|uniref:Glycosyltransferase RgtA/B/C/D-like domain-containing protein n=1 Tax=Actibacterium lipolyticum TaxID=1524263 RepID=A0A238KX20_9RHOB|nr:hypothetical protein [Actibacterium lipolyticum]SMX47267.1 hypothetical protein COL8621_03393 [Actibacterium lipolyticum]
MTRSDKSRLPRPGEGSLVTIAAFAGILLLIIYGRIMGYGIRKDEMMYVPPAKLMPDMSIYGDFFYNHVPYSAWMFHWVYELVGGGNVLYAARLTVFAGWVLLAISVILIMWRMTRSRAVVLFSVVLILGNDLLLSTPGMAGSNNFLPLPFAFLGLGLFLTETLSHKQRFLILVLSGICLSVAAGIKASAVVFIPPIAIGAFFLPTRISFGRRLFRVVLPLALGGAIGAVPLFYYLNSNPDLFLAHVIEFHTGPHVDYWKANKALEPGLALGLAGKTQLAYQLWFTGTNLLLAFAAVFFTFLVFIQRRRIHSPKSTETGQIIVVLTTTALTLWISFVPTPAFPQYFVLPIISLILLLGILYRQFGPQRKIMVPPALGAATLLILVSALPRYAPGTATFIDPRTTEHAKVAASAELIRQRLTKLGLEEGKVATLMPIYPVQAGLKVYPEFATGQFAYRIVPFTDPELLKQYRAVGPDGLSKFFSADPPSAFLLGYEPLLEAPLLNFAENKGYRRINDMTIPNRYGEGFLYVREPADSN